MNEPSRVIGMIGGTSATSAAPFSGRFDLSFFGRPGSGTLCAGCTSAMRGWRGWRGPTELSGFPGAPSRAGGRAMVVLPGFRFAAHDFYPLLRSHGTCSKGSGNAVIILAVRPPAVPVRGSVQTALASLCTIDPVFFVGYKCSAHRFIVSK